MSEVFSVVVTPLVEQLIKDARDLLVQEYKLLKGLEKDVEKLSSRLTNIQAVLQDAENKQQESSQVRDWLGKLKEFAYDSEDVLETLATEALLWQRKQKVRLFKPPFSASQVGYKLNGARAIKELLERLDDIEKEKAEFHLDVTTVSSTGSPEYRISSPIVQESDIVGREGDKMNIINMLCSEESDGEVEGNLSVIPIIGMGGLGKTTVAQLVYNDDRVKSHFPVMMWVCVTNNYDHKMIIKDMLEYGSKHDVNPLSNIQMLESRVIELLEGKRFLLVLDDVWNDNYQDWKRLENILNHGGMGSKVLITSRHIRVSEVMRTQPPYHLEYLPEDQCWLLFEKIAFPQNSLLVSNVRGVLEEIGKRIVNKCEGLPLAVCAMGGLLRGSIDIEKWRQILEHDIWEEEKYSTRTGKPVILPALRLSYDHLPCDLKQCFAICCLFPKAYVFHKMEVIQLWKAASLITPRGAVKLDDIGSQYFNELVSRLFFQVSNVGEKLDKLDEPGDIGLDKVNQMLSVLQRSNNQLTFRMHDLIHDLALSVSWPYCYHITDDARCSIPEKLRHISLLCRDSQKHILDGLRLGKFKRLRTLILYSEYSSNIGPPLDKLFHSCNYIRTLDLRSSMLTQLPESVGELILMDYLDLSNTEVRRLPNSLCKLYNLQTLKLRRCLCLFELPKDFSHLINLEHLELDDMFWNKSLTLPSKMGSLKNLQNLHAFRIGQKSGYGIDELKDMFHLKGSLHISRLENARKTGEEYLKDKESLVKVIYEWSSKDGSQQGEAEDTEMLEDLQPHQNIEEIEILYYQGDRLPLWLRHSGLKKLTTLSLKHCKNCKILSLGELPHLRKFRLKGLAELEEWPEAQYVNLQRLKISSCPKLKKVPPCFLNLESLKIKKCDSLEALPLTPPLMFLILIENLVLKDFNEQKVRFLHTNDQGERTINEQHSFWSLLEMKVINCSKLPELPKNFAPQKLEISGCPLLTNLPTSMYAGRLQQLAIGPCDDGRLVREIPNTSSLFSLVISNIQNLSSLPKLSHLPGLRVLHIHECNELVSLSDDEEPFQGLNSLELLSIQGCPKLETFPENMLPTSITCLIIGPCSSLKSLGPRDVLKKLTSLKDLYIEHCPELESLPEEGFPTSLQHLRIQGCPLLISRCVESGPDWPKIMDVPDLELESIEESSDQKSIEVPPDQNPSAWYQHLICCSKGQTSGGN